MTKEDIFALKLDDATTAQMLIDNGHVSIDDLGNDDDNNGMEFKPSAETYKGIDEKENEDPERFTKSQSTKIDIDSGNEDDLIGKIKKSTSNDPTDDSGKFNEKAFDSIENQTELSKEESFELGTALVGIIDLGMASVIRFWSRNELTDTESSPNKKRLDMLSMLMGKIIYKYQKRFPLVGMFIFALFVVYAPLYYTANEARKGKLARDAAKKKDGNTQPETNKGKTVKEVNADKPTRRQGRQGGRNVRDLNDIKA